MDKKMEVDMKHPAIVLILFALALAACAPQARPTSTRKPTTNVLVFPTISLTYSPVPSPASSSLPAQPLTPSPSKTPSRTPIASATPRPSATRTQTQTPSATAVVTVLTARAASLPVLTHDLQFIQDNRVLVWNHLTGQVEVKLDMNQWREGVEDPKFTYRGAKIIRISGEGQSESYSGTGAVDIDLIDTTTGKVQPLVHFDQVFGKNIVGGFSISPKGNWIAYSTGDWPQGIDHGLDNIVLHAIRLEPPYPKYKLAGYIGTNLSSQGIWSPDETRLIWQDDRGIWVSDLTEQTTHLLIAQKLGTGGFTGGFIHPRSEWSSSGRYLLAEVDGAIEGGSLAVFDTLTGRVSGIGDTWTYAIPGAQPCWISGDRLFIVYLGDWYEEKFPLWGRIWSLNPESESLFSLEIEFPIEDVDVRFVPYAPTQLGDGRLAFAIRSNDEDMYPIPENRWDGGLYVVSLEDMKPKRVNVLPKEGIQIIRWLPDGSGALVRYVADGSYMYVPSDGGPLWNLDAIVSQGAWFFEWLP
jgi:hypothetical protein